MIGLRINFVFALSQSLVIWWDTPPNFVVLLVNGWRGGGV
jgi:hypothetical protein